MLMDFKPNIFLRTHVKCYELQQVLWQNNHKFINVLNKFQTSIHDIENINFMNKFCLEKPWLDKILPHLFNTNVNFFYIILLFWYIYVFFLHYQISK
jgi:type IV secretory pathway VirB6-like protein